MERFCNLGAKYAEGVCDAVSVGDSLVWPRILVNAAGHLLAEKRGDCSFVLLPYIV